MNLFLQLVSFIYLLAPPQQEINSTIDEEKVKTSVITWADSTFQMHQNYKFEHFKAFYTDEYFIQSMRLGLYQDKIDALEQKKKNGTYTGSQEKYNEELKKSKDALNNAKKDIEKKVDRVTHYQIHFWSNIQMNDGITVYYELILKLDNDYKVTEANENSSIGKTGKSKISYHKEDQLIKVIEK